MKYIFLLLLTSLLVRAQNEIPKVINGKIERIEGFLSNYVTARNIDIWFPEGYDGQQKYPVLYMHDGQMLFDPETTWNKQAWNVDDVVAELVKSKKIKNLIVVGIWNGGATRHKDYFPENPFNSLTIIEKDSVSAQLKKAGRVKENFNPNSNNYLKFIVKELKPFIDKKYATLSNQQNTFIAGSSMGGLISMYAICEYPTIFGGAACLSTHWIGTFTKTNNPIPKAFLKYLEKKLPNPKNHKIYFDCGDQTLDAMYPEIQKQVDAILIQKGYTTKSALTKYFPGENHSEVAWNKRLNIPLEFLFGF